MSNPPQKISLYNANDLKNTTDDALAPYLTGLPAPYTFTQRHRLIDTRLAVGYAAVTVAGVLFYADWKLGWDGTKAYTLPACVLYFVLNSFLTYWIWAVERGTVFEGTRSGGQKLTLRSFGKKHTPTYRLHVKYEAPSGQKWEDREIVGNFTEWFNIHGYIDQKAFKRWLATNIEVIGLADPASKQVAEQKYDSIVDDVTMAAIASSLDAPTPSSSTTTKKSKRKT